MLTKSLQRVVKAVAIALPLISLGTQSALADPRNFTLINGSSLTIINLYISHVSENTWGSDVLGTDVLSPGESVPIVFPEAEPNVCSYDIKVTGQGGAEGRIDNVNLCTTETVTFN
jgi:hypothetical protein